MQLNLAWRTLVHDRGKLIVGITGVVFSFVLVCMQGGLFLGLIGKASVLIDRGNADIWISHRSVNNVDFPHPIPQRWRYVVSSIGGVEEVRPLRIEFGEMSLPGGGFENVLLVGVSPVSDLGHAYQIVRGPGNALQYEDAIIVDQADSDKFLEPTVNELREINGRRVRIAAQSQGVLSFVITPYVFTDIDYASELAQSDQSKVSYLLVRLQPGNDILGVCREIEARLPEVTAMPADRFASKSVQYWMTRTGLGISFGASTVLGLLVGAAIVGQTLYAMVLDRIGEYITLRAIGMREKELMVVLAIQSSLVATAGILIGAITSAILSKVLSTPRASIEIPPFLYLGCASIVFVICLFASLLPYFRMRRIDPHRALQAI